MQTANEIQSAVKNIKYYSKLIYELSRKQFEADCKQGEEIGINTESGSVRFDSLGAIGSACKYLDIYCENIESNLEIANKQDKLLYGEEKQT